MAPGADSAEDAWLDDEAEPPDVPDEIMRQVPKGAAALAGIALALLMAAWLAIYVFVFLPRGMVG